MFFLALPLIAPAISALSSTTVLTAGTALGAGGLALGSLLSSERERQKTKRAEIKAERDIACSKQKKAMKASLLKEKNNHNLRKMSLNALKDIAIKARQKGNTELYQQVVEELKKRANL